MTKKEREWDRQKRISPHAHSFAAVVCDKKSKIILLLLCKFCFIFLIFYPQPQAKCPWKDPITCLTTKKKLIIKVLLTWRSSYSSSIHQFYDSTTTQIRTQTCAIHLVDECWIRTPICQSLVSSKRNLFNSISVDNDKKQAFFWVNLCLLEMETEFYALFLQ